jgi:hypothetical protein
MEAILIGISMIAVTVAIHAIGSAYWLGFVRSQHVSRNPAGPTSSHRSPSRL